MFLFARLLLALCLFAWLTQVNAAAPVPAQPQAQPQPAFLDVVRGNEDYPPFEMMVEGKLVGLHVEMVEAAANSLGMRVRWTSLPWKRALLMVETGQADAITYISRTPEREAWAEFVEGNALSSAEVRFIARKEDVSSLDLTADLSQLLAQHSWATVRGFQFGKAEIDRAPRIEASNMDDLLRRLLAEHVKLAAVNWGNFKFSYRDRPEFSRVAALQLPVTSGLNYIAFSSVRGHAALAQRFAQAMGRFRQSGDYTQLQKRYAQMP